MYVGTPYPPPLTPHPGIDWTSNLYDRGILISVVILLTLQMLKLQSLKSEIRYTPNMILVKLVGSHAISQILLRISEIKRTKMVCRDGGC